MPEASTRRLRVCRIVCGAVVLLQAVGCSSAPSPSGRQVEPVPSVIRTLTPLPVPPPPPASGELYADLRETSRDRALSRFQVWITNDTTHAVHPRRVQLVDPRLFGPRGAERMRTIPARSERGFPIVVPNGARCDVRAKDPRIQVVTRRGSQTVDVADPVGIIETLVRQLCLEQSLEAVAKLRFLNHVPADGGGGLNANALLLLRVTPVGAPGHRLVIKTVAPTPILSAVREAVWTVGEKFSSQDQPKTIRLSVRPTRCDAHAFLESGGATTFRLRIVVDGEPGYLLLPMSERGAANAIDFAATSCGMGDQIR